MNEQEIRSEYLKDIESITSSKDLMDVRNKYLSKKGKVSELMTQMKEVPADQKAAFGQMVNNLIKCIDVNIIYE